MIATPTPVRGCLDVRTVKSSEAVELYILATCSRPAPAAEQAKEACAAVSKVLQAHDAWVVEERLFATDGAMETLKSARASTYGKRGGGVAPTCLAIVPEAGGEIAGVQVHALCGVRRPEELVLAGGGSGRIFRQKSCNLVTLSGITSAEAGTPGAQTTRNFEKAALLLKQAGGDFLSVARTWWWLRDICAWYGEFNQARREFFKGQGLLGNKNGVRQLPASTGIGLGPVGAPQCALDVIALVGGENPTRYYTGAGNQRSAFNYGSAFSRAAQTITPAGQTVFVSGTAAIDAHGNTCHLGDASGQIADTMENVRAVLKDLDCGDDDVVQAIAYCKTRDVEQVWNAARGRFGWPITTVLAEVCRDDLLFEVEATACPGARPL